MELEKKYSIAYKGLKNGLHEEDFDVDGTLFSAYESKDVKDGRCKVHVAMRKSETQLMLDVEIDGEVVCECDRCLEDCTIPVHYDGALLVHISDQAGEYDGDNMWVSPEEEDIDLTQYIYESIILSLPYRRVHPDGECDPDMMARFTAAGSQTEPDDTFADDSDAMQQAAADGGETLRTLGADNLRTLEALKAGMQHGHADKKEKK
ncbi:MAG: DUF177 domain-containing protein [Alistipes sp.]|nr:DUF177 domain-containing protein [Alistipes sp.]